MYSAACAVQKSLRSVIGSAASFFVSAIIIHFFACQLDPSFSLLLTRGVGKAALMWAAIVQICCFIAIQQPSFSSSFWRTAVSWPLRCKDLTLWGRFFTLFAGLHVIILSAYWATGHAHWFADALPLLIRRWPILLIGFVGTFLLAWSEELIFRGLLFQHFGRTLPLLTSAVLSSFIFAILHDLHNPLRLLTCHWQLGFGLFLLGMFLTYIRVWQNSIAASAGVHAGMVFIKVVLRKVPLLPIAAGSPHLFPIDLRESLILHALLLAGCIVLHAHIKQKRSS